MANNDLFASVVTEIKSYTGKDPLLPWTRGIRKMKDSLPPHILKEKLPRFLQKCAQAFESDRRYQNDLRYLRVWLQLMDFVDDPRALLKTMESNCIGAKHSLFYQAYALFYEKSKKFDEAEKMYHLGVQNLAEPADELQKSYEQFLRRAQRHKKRLERTRKHQSESNSENESRVGLKDDRGKKNENMSFSDDTVVAKFVGTAIDGMSEAENACHHGLVDPTVNMKDAMNDINNMFCEPLESVPIGRSRQRRRPANNDENSNDNNNGFAVFVDEDCGEKAKPLEIFIDEEEEEENEGGSNVFVFPTPKDLPDESSDDMDEKGSSRPRFREDTVVRRFVGSAILDQPEVENVCHHGLVDPTVNLKEAMDDINNMFGKPIDFVRSRRSKKQDKEPDAKSGGFGGGFTILADDEPEQEPAKNKQPVLKSARKSRGSELFEPTMVTKEAIDDINKMFGMPLDF